MQTVPPLQRSDLPPSAVDFHVSGIIEWLLQHAEAGPAASEAAQALNSEPAAALKTAMWRLSSSTNAKQLLGGQVRPCQVREGLRLGIGACMCTWQDAAAAIGLITALWSTCALLVPRQRLEQGQAPCCTADEAMLEKVCSVSALQNLAGTKSLMRWMNIADH